MIRRVISGTTLVACLAGLLWLDHLRGQPWAFLCIASTVLFMGAAEVSLMHPGPWPRARAVLAGLGALGGVAVPSLLSLYPGAGPYPAWTALVLTGLFMGAPLAAGALRLGPGPQTAAAVAWTVFAAGYVGFLGSFSVWLRLVPGVGEALLVFLVGVTKATDMGAYFTGRAVGRHKLAPRISPGKTWEGLAGGAAASGVVALILVWLLELDVVLPWPLALGLGILMAVLGQSGDLFESVLKRSAGLKDSSMLIPGQGGFLDVIDSLLATSPILFLVALIRLHPY